MQVSADKESNQAAESNCTWKMQGSWHYQWTRQRMPGAQRTPATGPIALYQFDVDVLLREIRQHDKLLSCL